MLKKIFIGIFVVALLGAAALFFALPYLNINRYTPMIMEKIKAETGIDAAIGHIGLKWQGALLVELKNLSMTSPIESTPFITVDSVQVEIKPKALLQKCLELGSISVIRPKARLIKREGQWIQFPTIPATPNKPATSKSPSSKSAESFKWSIDRFTIIDADVTLVQVANRKVSEFHIGNVDIDVRNPMNPTIPGAFEANAAVFSDKQNFNLKGALQSVDGIPIAKDLSFNLDGASVDWAKAGVSLPLLKTFEGIAGQVKFEEGRIILEKTSAGFGGGRLDFNADFKNYLDPDAKLNMDFKGADLDMTKLMPVSNPVSPRFEGLLSAGFQGEAWGNSWPLMSGSMNGKGEISLKQSKIANLNALRALFEKLSQIPGVSDTLNRLPPKYAAMMSFKDTALPDMRLPFQINQGLILFPQVAINTMGLEIHLRVNAGLDGSVAGEIVLALEQELSTALLQSLPQMAFIANSEGKIMLPVKVSGNIRHPSLKPDMEYVISRVLAGKGQELLSSLFQKRQE